MALDAWARPRARSTARRLGRRRPRALRAGEVDGAMVPIENSVEGGVSATLDALASGDPLVVVGEVLVPITFVLAARPGMPLAEVRAVGTHSHAWAQVRGWMARTSPTRPTSRRCRRPPRRPGWPARWWARGIPGRGLRPVAARNHGLEVLAEDIGDNAVGGDAVRARRAAGRRCPSAPGPTRRRWCCSSATTTPVGCSSCWSSSRCAASTCRGWSHARPRRRWAATASPSTSRATSSTSGSARRCSGSSGSARRCGSSAATRRRTARRSASRPHTTDEAFGEARAWLRSLRGAG